MPRRRARAKRARSIALSRALATREWCGEAKWWWREGKTARGHVATYVVCWRQRMALYVNINIERHIVAAGI